MVQSELLIQKIIIIIIILGIFILNFAGMWLLTVASMAHGGRRGYFWSWPMLAQLDWAGMMKKLVEPAEPG